MNTYNITIMFCSDRAYLNIADSNTFYFLHNEPYGYNTRVLIDQYGLKVLADDDDGVGVDMKKHKDAVYIDNVIIDFYNNYVRKTECSSKSLEIFTQYIHYIVEDFVDKTKTTLHCEILNISLTFVTPRIWGYHVNGTDIHTIAARAGSLVINEITVYNDLNIRVESIQVFLKISRLRTCLFCTFFLDFGPYMSNSVETFFSGTYYNDFVDDSKIQPVNCKSLSPIAHKIDITGIYSHLETFITTQIHGQDIQHAELIESCIRSIVEFLRKKTLSEDAKVKCGVNLDQLFPFRQGRGDDGQLKQDGDGVSNDSKTDKDTIIKIALKDISIQNIFAIFQPHLEPFICAFQSILQQCSAREVFIELFKKPHNLDRKHVYIALISAYFIHYELNQRNDEYVHTHYTNFFAEKDCYYSLHFWMHGTFSALGNRQLLNSITQSPVIKHVAIKANEREPCHTKDKKKINYIINLNLSLEDSRVSVLSKSVRNKGYKWCDGINISVEPFEVLKTMYFDEYNSRKSMITGRFALKKMLYSLMRLSIEEAFDVNDVQGQFHYQPKKLLTFDDILQAMYVIELHSQTPKCRILFQHHKMKILLTLYIMHISEKLCLKSKHVGYVIILDPLLDTVLGKKQSVIKYFALEFGLLSKNADVKKNMVIFKKRRAYVLKLQEDAIFSSIPLMKSFYQIQITKNYCQITWNTVFLKNEKISTTEIDTYFLKYNFWERAIENLWCHFALHNEYTLTSFQTFKSQMRFYLGKVFLLKVGTDLDSISYINLDNNTLFEFTCRIFIDVAIIPAFKEITSFIAWNLMSLSNHSFKPWHTFLMLENFTGRDVDLRTNMVHQLLKYEINKQMVELYDKNKLFDRADYSMTEITDTDLCFINKEPLGLYSLTVGYTHLHRTFNATYAVQFLFEGKFAEGIVVYESGISSRYKQQTEKEVDLSSKLIIAKEGEKTKLLGKEIRFRIQNNRDTAVYMFFYRIPEADQANSTHDPKLDSQLIGVFNLEQFFKSEEYIACPILFMKFCHTEAWPLSIISVFTLSENGCQFCTQVPPTIGFTG